MKKRALIKRIEGIERRLARIEMRRIIQQMKRDTQGFADMLNAGVMTPEQARHKFELVPDDKPHTVTKEVLCLSMLDEINEFVESRRPTPAVFVPEEEGEIDSEPPIMHMFNSRKEAEKHVAPTVLKNATESKEAKIRDLVQGFSRGKEEEE